MLLSVARSIANMLISLARDHSKRQSHSAMANNVRHPYHRLSEAKPPSIEEINPAISSYRRNK